MDPKDFVHLHVHSHFSLLQALPSPKALVSRAKEQGAKALAITDNGVLYGAVAFYQACRDAEITPIIGLDMYIAQNRMTDKRGRIDDRPYRLPILALNDAGYKNLLKISSAGFLEGFYYKPRVDKEFLRSHAEGLVAMSGSLNGEIPKALAMDNLEQAAELAHEYEDIFGKGNFYLELIYHPDLPRQIDINNAIKTLAKETGVPLVATKNIFYMNPDDREGYEAQQCIMRGRTLEAFRQTSAEDVDLSFCPAEEIIEYFKDAPEALENTKKIADRVNFEMDLGNNYLPIFPMPEGKTDNDYLYDLSLVGMKDRYGEMTPENQERLDFEFGVIKRMGYASYFIIVQDFIMWAKGRGILVGPGRGSAAGSIIAYALRITDIDPMRYGLLFERFLNPDRISMPDIDMDFADSKRGEVLEYVTEKYGVDHVAGIITFGTMMPRAAVRDAARVLGLTYDEADMIAKTVPEPVQGRHIPLGTAIEDDPELSALYQANPMAKQVIDLARKMEGNPRHTSQHACGFVIGDKPLVERVPLQSGQREDMALITQYSLNSAEAVGLVKMDFLGLSNLTVIQDALDIIKAVHGVKIDIDTIPLDDEKTFALLGRGETTGVFQLESDGMKRYIRELKPTEFEDIVAMVALYRPGPLSAGMVPQYIRRKNKKEKVEFDHPLMKEILQETYGVTIYQEQIMKISRLLAGFTAGEADTLRKAMGKKKHEILAKMYTSFIDGCKKNGVSEKIAKKIWTDWEGFADYAFNKSHAACYGIISYRTAYLKAHYTPEFMAAVMNSDLGSIDRITIEVEECERIGLNVLPPDVNESYPGFAVVPETGNIRWGLNAIKNVGIEVAKGIVAERKENGLYMDLADFVSRVPYQYFNKKSVESLIKSGALDRYADRSQLVASMDQLLLFNKQVHKEQEQNQVSMFDLAPQIAEAKLVLRTGVPIQTSQLLSWEKELLGLYVSTHPMDDYKEALKPYINISSRLKSYEDGTMVKMAGVITEVKRILTKKKQEPMAFVRLEDWEGSFELVVFPRTFKAVEHMLETDRYCIIAGKVSVRERNDEEEWSVLCDKILEFKQDDLQDVAHMLKDGMWFESFEDPQEEQVTLAPEEGLSILVPEKPTHEMIDSLRNVFRGAPGDQQVYLVVDSGGAPRRIKTEFLIDNTPETLMEIGRIVGEENVSTSSNHS
jgi:DNA polymerase III subunit alpha